MTHCLTLLWQVRESSFWGALGRWLARAAATELAELAAPGRHVRYVASDECTANEVAQVLGAAIGQPALPWVALTDAQMQHNLVSHGLPAARAADVVAIYASIGSGALGADYAQHKPPLGQVKLEEFAQEFAAAFGGGRARPN